VDGLGALSLPVEVDDDVGAGCPHAIFRKEVPSFDDLDDELADHSHCSVVILNGIAIVY